MKDRLTQKQLDRLVTMHERMYDRKNPVFWIWHLFPFLFKAEKLDLYQKDISGLSMRGKNLINSSFEFCDMRDMDLRGTDLTGSYLYGNDLSGSDMSGSSLTGAYVDDVKMESVTGAPSMTCPEKGKFTGWKVVRENWMPYLIELEIPEDARRSSATGRKCRCDKAFVKSITDMQTGKRRRSVTNLNFHVTEYTVGKYVFPDSFDDNRWNECSNGIHFFMTKKEAKDYSKKLL